MKRKITVEINIDDTGVIGSSQIRQHSAASFEIFVTPDCIGNGTEFDKPITLVHELGHLVGMIFDLPGAAMDPRGISNPAVVFPGQEGWTKVMESEKEAWNVGEQIMKEMLQTRIKALASYDSLPVPDLSMFTVVDNTFIDWSTTNGEQTEHYSAGPETSKPGFYRTGSQDQADTGQAPEESEA